jgi:adenylate cyclase
MLNTQHPRSRRRLLPYGPRVAVTLLPLLFALLHALGVLPMGALQRMDHSLFDARMRASLAHTHEDRIVIVDIDEKSLAALGRWPWSRHLVARLVDTLFEDQHIGLLGFDMVFAEPDESSGLRQLQLLAIGPLANQHGFAQSVAALQPELDYDARLARALRDRPVVLGYYFTSDRNGHSSGTLPEPVLPEVALQTSPDFQPLWNGYGANIASLVQAAPRGGFVNALTGSDGVVRALPVLAVHGGQHYESLALAMFRLFKGSPPIEPGVLRSSAAAAEAMPLFYLQDKGTRLKLPLDQRLAMLVPFKGPGGPQGGTFTYLSAIDVLTQRVAAGSLKDKIVLIGSSAPGLLALRVTPVGEAYPGVETHANLLASLLDGRHLEQPDYAAGYELVVLLVAGLLLALLLPRLSPTRALTLGLAVVVAVIGLNSWLYFAHGLVLPMASALVMAVLAVVLNMGYGHLVESRDKRELAQLFGTYVPPELVEEMLKQPERYSMVASTRELTVLFSDLRGFTRLAEPMEPIQLQALLNMVFSRLTQRIRNQRGTIDKYMGDGIMAFWGAPVDTPLHAALAVQAALDMVDVIDKLNQEQLRKGLSPISLGIGLNTGQMCVGDMGSDVRRSYTVVGDAVNLGARLEGLSSFYGVDVVASQSTRDLTPQFVWQELDRVRVKGKTRVVRIYTPLGSCEELGTSRQAELQTWEAALQAWRSQDWDLSQRLLQDLQRQHATKVLYSLYAQRVALMKQTPPLQHWDGTTNFDTK